MSMVPKQALHAQRIAKLIIYADSIGYAVTGGDWYRDERCPYGSRMSKHRSRLATDLNLFKIDQAGNYVYLQSTEDHRPLGEYWKAMGGTWGGDFGKNNPESRPDGNHYQTD